MSNDGGEARGPLGMSVLDEFAKAALTGILAGASDREPNHWVYGKIDELATEAYRIGIAMLDEQVRRQADVARKIWPGSIHPADPPHNEPEVKQRFVGMVGDLVELEYGVPEEHYRLILVRGSKSVTTEIDLLNVTEEDALGTLNMHLLSSIKAHKRYRERYGIPNG